jgi:hypothetical protein
MGKARKIVEGIEQAEREDESIAFDSTTRLIEPQLEPERDSDPEQVGAKPVSESVRLATKIYD